MGKSLEPAPPGGKPREARTRVSLTVRIRTDTGWIDGTALNVSSKGIMLKTAQPISSSGYVEIRRGTQVAIVGRVVWSKGTTIGLKTQDRIDIDQLLNSTRDRAPNADAMKERRTPKPPPPALTGRSSSKQYARRQSAGRHSLIKRNPTRQEEMQQGKSERRFQRCRRLPERTRAADGIAL